MLRHLTSSLVSVYKGSSIKRDNTPLSAGMLIAESMIQHFVPSTPRKYSRLNAPLHKPTDHLGEIYQLTPPTAVLGSASRPVNI